jgi:hypothetical protein
MIESMTSFFEQDTVLRERQAMKIALFLNRISARSLHLQRHSADERLPRRRHHAQIAAGILASRELRILQNEIRRVPRRGIPERHGRFSRCVRARPDVLDREHSRRPGIEVFHLIRAIAPAAIR